MLSEQSFVSLMKPFFRFVKTQVRESENGLAYYGTGEASSWAVQSNFNIAGALAVLASAQDVTDAEKEEYITLALKLFRYNLATHKTGDMACSCGSKWGGTWITVLGLERMVCGQLELEPYFTAEDRESFRKLRIYEADWILEHYETVAAIEAETGKNKPESNYWNGSFLFRTAMDYPDTTNREAYLEKSRALLLNAISHPDDAASTELFHGKELRHWHVGANFTPQYSLDHHGYMNVGYSVVTLSQAAYLYFYCKTRKWEMPPEALHHVRDLWNVVKNFIFPDGRLLRIGGDTRARYCYCQMYLLPVLLMVQELYHDPDAPRLAQGMLELLRNEQQNNPDGSFFGTRLQEMKRQSRFYYVRLESDPFAVLAAGVFFKQTCHTPGDAPPHAVEWHDDYHDAALVRTAETVRSVVRKGGNGMTLLNLPVSDSDLAEWEGNGFAHLTCHKILANAGSKGFLRTFPGGFLHCGKAEWIEYEPWGEGEASRVVAESRYACAALPDGKTMIVLEKLTARKEQALSTFRSAVWQIPNDLFNGYTRTFTGNQGFSRTLRGRKEYGIIDTGSKWINVDDKVTVVLGYGAETLKLYAPAKAQGAIKIHPQMTSLYLNEICAEVYDPAESYLPGTIMADTGFAVVSGITASAGMPCRMERLATQENVRAVTVTDQTGKVWQFAANLGTEDILWNDQLLPAGAAFLHPLS